MAAARLAGEGTDDVVISVNEDKDIGALTR